jgi:hypothetical protein
MKSKIQAQPYPNPAITFSLKFLLFFQGDMCDTCPKSIILPKNNIVERNSHSKPEVHFSKGKHQILCQSQHPNPGHVTI